MSKTNNHENSDSFWGVVTGYASSLWDSWDKDFDEYAEDVLETNDKSDEENFMNTSLQHSVHSVELVSHLVGSVFSNDYTKERVKELGQVIESTDSYQSAKETMHELETTISQVSEQFMQEHPKVQTAFMATEEKLEEAKAYVTQEAQKFATNHPEITSMLASTVEIGATVSAVKAGKVALETRALNKLDKLDYKYTQGNELARGIPSEVDKSNIDFKELAVTAEAKVDKESFFDTNQEARVKAYPFTPALRHDEIRAKEAKKVASVEKDIEKAEKDGKPFTEEEKADMFYKTSKPNATLAQSHAETAIIQRAYEQGLTQDAHMFIKVNGKDMCGNCSSDTIAMAKESGLKSITINNYKILEKEDNKLDYINHWQEGMSKLKRYDSFEKLEKDYPQLPKTPDHIKHAGVIEAERTSMNAMDVALLGAGGIVLMHEGASEESTLDQEALEQRIDPQSHQTINIIEIEDRQNSKIDTTAKAEELINTLFPHLQPTNINQAQHHKREEENQNESSSSQSYENRGVNSNEYSEDESFSVLKNHRPIDLQNNLSQQTVEEELNQEEQFRQAEQRIYDDIAEKYGNSNDYENDYDRGIEID